MPRLRVGCAYYHQHADGTLEEGGVCLLFGVGRLARAVVKEEELSLEEWEALELLVELRERHLTCATREKHVAQAEAHQGRYRVGVAPRDQKEV